MKQHDIPNIDNLSDNISTACNDLREAGGLACSDKEWDAFTDAMDKEFKRSQAYIKASMDEADEMMKQIT